MSKSPGLYNFNLDFSSVNSYSYMRKCGVFMETRTAIIEEYKKLVISEKRANVSISEICKNVGISRKTFYNYFRDRYAIIEEIYLRDIELPIRMSLNVNAVNEYYVQTVYQSFLLKKDFYCIAIKEEGANSLYENIVKRLSVLTEESLTKMGKNEKEIYYLSYKFAVTMASLINLWMKNGMHESPEFMAKIYLETLPHRELAQ